jgi:hypothetical protein
MKKSFTFLVILLVINLLSYSQGNFTPGSIINNNGDSIVGLIKIQEEIKLKDFCQFKENKESKAKKLTPEEIKSFRFKNKYYVSKRIYKEGKPVSVFLEYLVDGNVDLYFMRDKAGIHYYVQSEKDSLSELLNTSKLVVVEGVQYNKDFKEYTGTLNTVLKDYPPIFSDILKIKFSHKDLVKLIKRYNDEACSDQVCIVYSKNIKPTTYIGFKVGASCLNPGFTSFSDLTSYWKDLDFGFVNVLSYSFLISQKNLFGSNNLSQNLSVGFSNDIYRSTYYTIDYKTISIPFYFSYYFPIDSFRPFVNFGLDNVFVLRDSYSVYQGNSGMQGRNLDDPLLNYQMNGMFGIGLEIATKSMNYFISGNWEIGSGTYGRSTHQLSYQRNRNYRWRFEVGCSFKIGK